MFQLVLKNGRSRVEIPDVDSLEFRGHQLWLPGGSQPAMRYEDGRWTHREKQWIQLECRALLCVQLESDARQRGPRIGPRPSFTLREAYAFAGRERIATLISTDYWRDLDSRIWPILRVVSAELPENTTLTCTQTLT